MKIGADKIIVSHLGLPHHYNKSADTWQDDRVSSKDYILFWLVAMETSQFVSSVFLQYNMSFNKDEIFPFQIR